MTLTAALLGVLLCGAAGVLVPRLIAAVPERSQPSAVGAGEASEDPPPSYAEVGRRPGLALRTTLAAAVAGGLVGGTVGWAWPLLFLLPLVPVGVALAVIDWHTRLLPTIIIWPTLGVTAVLAGTAAILSGDAGAWLRAVVGAAVVGGVFFVLWYIRSAGMGFGDVRLSTLLGFALGYLGWPELLIGIYGAFLAFAVPGLLLALLRRDRAVLRAAYPFGPFLVAGALAGVVAGEALWSRLAAG